MKKMTPNNNEAYSLSVGKSDLERMTILGDIYMPYCRNFLLENGLKEGLTVTDIGCGPGNVSLWLSEQVGVTGEVLSIDNSGAQLAILDEQILKRDIQNITTLKTDIYDLDKIEERFDLVFCRFTLVHLSQPLIAIQKMRSLLKPGGCLIIAELDNATWFSYPENEALQKDIALLCETGKQKEIDLCIGPKLYGYLQQTNFNSVHVKIAQPVLNKEYRDYLILKCMAWRDTYLQLDLISSSEFQTMLHHLYDLVHNEQYLLAGAKMYLTTGIK
jgi:ubiquinone/menaquinone biosynthesis C-methylase UbiE